MSGFRIVCIRLSFFEDDASHASSQVVVEWAHSAASAVHVLKLCDGGDLHPDAMLECYGSEAQRMPLKTVRVFRFESRVDALAVYDRFEAKLRAQEKVRDGT